VRSNREQLCRNVRTYLSKNVSTLKQGFESVDRATID